MEVEEIVRNIKNDADYQRAEFQMKNALNSIMAISRYYCRGQFRDVVDSVLQEVVKEQTDFIETTVKIFVNSPK